MQSKTIQKSEWQFILY